MNGRDDLRKMPGLSPINPYGNRHGEGEHNQQNPRVFAPLRLRVDNPLRSQRSLRFNRFWWWMIPLLLLTFWLGARSLDADSLWYDEYFSIYDAGGAMFERRTPSDIWNGVAERNPWHAPGFFILLSGWGRIAGWQPPVLRALSLFVGTLAVAWTYRLGKDLFSARIGLMAAGILGTAALYVHFLHELRMYSLVVLLSVFTIWIYFRLIDLERPPKWWEWASLLLGAVGMLYTHFFAALPLITVGLYHLILAPKNGRWLRVTGIFALAGVLFLPWFGVLLDGIAHTVEDTGVQEKALSANQAVLLLLRLFSNGSPVLLVLIGVLAIRPPYRDRNVWRVGFLALTLLALTLAVNAAVQVLHEGRVRYLLSLMPLLSLLAALSMARLTRWHFAPWILLIVWMLTGAAQTFNSNFTATFDGSGYLFPIQDVARALRQSAGRDDFIVGYLPADGNPEASYRRMRGFYFNDLPVESTFRQVDRVIQDPNRHPEQMLDLVSESPRFWLAYMPNHDTEQVENIRRAVEERYNLCAVTEDRSDLYLALYAREPVCCHQSAEPAYSQFGDGVTLAAVDTMQMDETLRVSLMWRLAEHVPPNRYSVGLKLFDSAENDAAGVDYGLEARAYTCQPSEISIADLPPGEYRLKATVYAWETGDRLTGKLNESGEQSDLLPLATFTVSAP
jgi:hypothetical protein